jgi:hypothetical protein
MCGQGGQRDHHGSPGVCGEKAGHALIAARQWIPAEHIADPVKSADMCLPGDLIFRTKGQLAIGLLTEAFADGIRLDFICGGEVYGSCTQLHEYLEERGQGYVLRVPSNFHLTPGPRGEAAMQAGGRPAAGWEPVLGGPLGRAGLQGSTLVTRGRGWPRSHPAATC